MPYASATVTRLAARCSKSRNLALPAIAIRMNEPRMPALLTASGRRGFYLRVLQKGEAGPGNEIIKVGEAKERMSVAEINALLIQAIDWNAHCGSTRFPLDGARRLRRYCRAERAVMRGSRRQRLRIRLRQDFGRLR